MFSLTPSGYVHPASPGDHLRRSAPARSWPPATTENLDEAQVPAAHGPKPLRNRTPREEPVTDAMPHLDDAGENDDVVALLMQQHNHIRGLFAEVENAATADDRAEAFRRLVRLLAVHETAEEEVVHPSARRLLRDGEQVVDDRLEEERAAKEKLSRLDDMNPDDPGFMPALRELRADVLQHAVSEEQYEFPGLREKAGARQLALMATAVRAAEAMAPTRPHPGVETVAENVAVGPVAAVIDRTRDAVRKAMGNGS